MLERDFPDRKREYEVPAFFTTKSGVAVEKLQSELF